MTCGVILIATCFDYDSRDRGGRQDGLPRALFFDRLVQVRSGRRKTIDRGGQRYRLGRHRLLADHRHHGTLRHRRLMATYGIGHHCR